MYRRLLGLVFLFCSIGAMGANSVAPDWLDVIKREALYPSNKYYTGFATSNVKKGEDKTDVYERVKQNARIDAISSIQISVEQTVERYMKNTQSQGVASSIDIMSSYAKTRTSIKDVPGLNIEVWEDPKTGDISAFAWISATDLSKRLMRRILTNVAKAEVEINTIEEIVARGDKSQAKMKLQELQLNLDNLESDQRVLLSVTPNVQDDDIAINETNALKKRYHALFDELKNGINIYIECNADLFGINYEPLKKEIQGALSQMGCSFVSSSGLSDWSIYITTAAREYNSTSYGNFTTYVTYLDASIAIEKMVTHQRIYENQLTEKGTHTHNYEQAARDAYKKIAPEVSNIIKEQIQK